MPSVYSFSRPRLWPSSTVMTPSLPTLSITSAMISPTSGSAAEIAATAAIWSRVSTLRDCLLISSTMTSTAFSRPCLRIIGLAPALTVRRPSLTIDWARTTAVVVPSPATSSVLVATSLSSWAPMFSNGSSSSMSRAMVTPSLVMVGDPNFLSSTTLRPFGPSVTLTASAIRSMPCLSSRRAVSSKMSCFAMWGFSSRSGGAAAGAGSVLDDGEDVLLADDEEILLVHLELGARVLGIEDLLALFDVDMLALPVVEDAAGTDGQDLALLGLLLGGVGQDDATLGGLFARGRLDDHAITERAKLGLGSGGCGQGAILLRRPRSGRQSVPGTGAPRARDDPDTGWISAGGAPFPTSRDMAPTGGLRPLGTLTVRVLIL